MNFQVQFSYLYHIKKIRTTKSSQYLLNSQFTKPLFEISCNQPTAQLKDAMQSLTHAQLLREQATAVLSQRAKNACTCAVLNIRINHTTLSRGLGPARHQQRLNLAETSQAAYLHTLEFRVPLNCISFY